MVNYRLFLLCDFNPNTNLGQLSIFILVFNKQSRLSIILKSGCIATNACYGITINNIISIILGKIYNSKKGQRKK